MKNLFKNLMLVAVAAMAFTACTETNDEVNAVVEKTVLTFTANIADDTRSGFAEKEEGATAYKSEWFGDETLKVCANGAFASAQEVNLEDAEGHFTVVFEGTAPTHIDVFSPASAWSSEYYPTIPAEQTPRAKSVDPAAHILKAQAADVASGMVTMEHQVAYGKMTVNTPADFEISKVELSLVGLPNSYWSENQTYSYTLYADNVEGNTFWFATQELGIVKEFTVTAYNAGGDKYTKTVSGLAEGKLSFISGQVSTFSVSNLEEVGEYVAFTRAYKADDAYYTSDYVIWFEGPAGTLKTNPCQITTDDWALIPGTYNVGTAGQCFYSGTWTRLNDLTSNGGTITVSVVDGMYHFDFNISHTDGTVFTGSYTGLVEGLNMPDLRTKLAAPSNVTGSAVGKTITLSWDAVEGAEGYRVKLYSPDAEYFEEIVTTTEYVYEAQLSDTMYHFTIMSYVSDTNATYRSSEDAYADVRTEDIDPMIVLSKETISFTADGGDDAVDVTLKNIDGDFTYTVDAEWLTVTRSGASLAVSAPAYENESENRSATITITAGELTKEISVIQTAPGGGIVITSISVAYDQPGEKEIQFHASDGMIYVIDFKGSANVQKGQPVAEGYYSSSDSTIDASYSYYGYGTIWGTPTFVDCQVTNNTDGTQTYEARMVYEGQTYSWTYTGNYPA